MAVIHADVVTVPGQMIYVLYKKYRIAADQLTPLFSSVLLAIFFNYLVVALSTGQGSEGTLDERLFTFRT